MAATQTAAYTENTLAAEESARRRRYTDADAEKPAAIYLPQGTNPSSNTATGSAISGRPEMPKPAPGLFPPVMGRRTVDAVIDEIMRDSVIVRCLLPTGNTVDLRLPPSVIPSQLLRYGQPVTVSLDTASGVRVPRIEARRIAPQSDDFSDQKVIDDWLNSI